MGFVFRRSLAGGWKTSSIAGVRLSNMHPKGQDLAINRATLTEVKTDTGYFRALITDQDPSRWESRPDWLKKAKAMGWRPKDRAAVLAAKRKKLLTPLVQETADFFEAEIARMAKTAMHTAAYANGQTVPTVIKAKDIGFTREELEEEIAALLHGQDRRCALTSYEFKTNWPNPHLRTSLDRKDSSLGYIPGNLQIVTRAANFYKSASDIEDWKLKAKAMEKMAIAMQQARKQPAEAQ